MVLVAFRRLSKTQRVTREEQGSSLSNLQVYGRGSRVFFGASERGLPQKTLLAFQADPTRRKGPQPMVEAPLDARINSKASW